MVRLTEKVFGYTQLAACGNDFCKETCEQHDNENSCDNCPIQKAIEKLSSYEDLEEQGLLLRLPCKVGNIVYKFDTQMFIDCKGCKGCLNHYDDGIEEFCDCDEDYPACMNIFETKFGLDMLNEIGKTVFLTKAEAEEALKRMTGEEEVE